MSLKSLLFDKSGSVWLNSLRRFCLSGLVVPQQNLLIAKIPTAQSATQPGRATPIPMQGPADASSEIYSFTGKQNVTFQGIGSITTTGGDVNVVGTGTKFTTQLQVGDTISTTAGSGTIATITSDTTATTSIAMAANALANFFFVTPLQGGIQAKTFVSITDQSWRRRLMNRDVPTIHVFGSNTKPLFIKESLLLETDQTLLLEFLNYDTNGPASFAPISEGRKWQYEAMKSTSVYDYIAGLRQRKEYIQPYWLTLNDGWSSMAAGVGDTKFLTCTGDITLVLFNLYGQAFAADGTDVSSKVLCSFTDAKTMRALQTTPVPLSLCAGTSQNPFLLPTPLIVEPQTQIKVDFTNNNAVSCKVYLTFHGVAIYTGSSFRGSTLNNKFLKEEGQRMYDAMSTPQIRPAEAQG